MSTNAPKPELAHIKGCTDVLIHTVRALADALEACRDNGGDCSCGCCCSCKATDQAA